MIYSTLIIKGNTGCSFLPQVDSNCARRREVKTNEKGRVDKCTHTLHWAVKLYRPCIGR